jgi:alpha-galactosidase/6-phospho-beta-glucosidase family protein
MPNNKIIINECELRKWYVEEKLSAQKIAKKCDCCAATVLKYLYIYDIPVRTIGQANFGLKRSEEAKENYRNSWTKERKEKYGLEYCGLNHKNFGKRYKNGQVHTEEYKKKLSERVRGERNPMYGKKGHLSPSWISPNQRKTVFDKQVRNCFQYKEWRTNVFSRDKYTCQTCNKKGGKLQVHHIEQLAFLLKKYEINSLNDAVLCKELWDEKNGKVLCIECHKKTDNYAKRFSRKN